MNGEQAHQHEAVRNGKRNKPEYGTAVFAAAGVPAACGS